MTPGFTQARAKTDRLDARALARLLWSGELESVWMPDERCRVLRRRLARREQLVRSRTRAKNEIQAVLQRRLQGKPPCSDLFGVKGRRWLAGLELPLEERESVDAGIRHIDFLDAEIAAVERLIAQQARNWPEIRRVMTVPGVNVIGAAIFLAGIWHAHQQPAPTTNELRRLQTTAGAPARKRKPSGVWVTHQRMRQAERQLAAQAEASYKRLVTDRQAAAPTRKVGASVTAERA